MCSCVEIQDTDGTTANSRMSWVLHVQTSSTTNNVLSYIYQQNPVTCIIHTTNIHVEEYTVIKLGLQCIQAHTKSGER